MCTVVVCHPVRTALRLSRHSAVLQHCLGDIGRVAAVSGLHRSLPHAAQRNALQGSDHHALHGVADSPGAQRSVPGCGQGVHPRGDSADVEHAVPTPLRDAGAHRPVGQYHAVGLIPSSRHRHVQRGHARRLDRLRGQPRHLPPRRALGNRHCRLHHVAQRRVRAGLQRVRQRAGHVQGRCRALRGQQGQPGVQLIGGGGHGGVLQRGVFDGRGETGVHGPGERAHLGVGAADDDPRQRLRHAPVRHHQVRDGFRGGIDGDRHGGAGLIQFVVKNATVPVIETGAGICHLYVDKDADLNKALTIAVNAKIQRPSVCNAIETILVHKDVADKFLPELKKAFEKVEIKGDDATCQIINCEHVTDDSYATEYDDYIVNIRVVDSVEEAINHIYTYSTKHSESIITENNETAALFMNSLDSACVYHNASTRFSDGGEFGFGAELGISTQKLHARGPLGLKEMCSYQYKIEGNGQIRE